MIPPGEPGGAGIYLHVPFCARICPYCDFAVRTGRGRDRDRYLGALEFEIALRAGEGLVCDTIYLGGGTPSLLEPESLDRILESIRTTRLLAPDTRVHLEANPEDADTGRLRAWRAMGVSFLSLGVQSFDEAALRFLVRRHTPAQARRSVEAALEAGFETVSVDLIYGLPGQEESAWRSDLEAAAGLGPQHLSCYQLTIHDGTHFGRLRGRGALTEAPEEAQADLFLLTHRYLGEEGYAAYEVSNFARSPAHRSRHNRKYWDHTPYLGLGPSAHSYRDARRWWNEPEWRRWASALEEGRAPVAAEELLGPEDLALEAFMLAMRTPEGVDLPGFRERYDTDLEARNAGLFARLEKEGLVLLEGRRLRPTLEGMAVADTLARQVEIGGDPDG